MTDPRDRVETFSIRCCAVGEEWEIGAVGRPAPSRSDWPEVVELAQKILAANEAWLDANTPTLEELRAEHPQWQIHLEFAHGKFRVWAERLSAPGHPIGRDAFVTGCAALRWLAAKLDEMEAAS